MRIAPRIATCAAVACLLAAPARARAQEPGSEAAATALFDEGRKLMAQQHYAEACPKLAESERLAPSGGTLLNLAECYEHTGQTASAWVAWKDAAARANAAGKADVEKRALARAAALEPGLAKLTITVNAASDVSGLEVKRDGVRVGHAEFGLPVPVDPGSHVVEASAPSKKPFSTKVDVAAKQKDARITVTLEDAPESASPPASASAATTTQPQPSSTSPAAPPSHEQPAAAPSGLSGQKTLAIVAGAVGLVGVGLGTAFGLAAKSKNDDALQPNNCRTPTLCTQTGLNLTDDAKTDATLSTIAFVAGGAALAAGVVLWLTAPSPATTTTAGVRIAPELARSYGGLSLRGDW